MAKKDKTQGFEKVETMAEDTLVAYYELTGQKPSGFIQEGTERLPEPIQITSPSLRKIRSTSHYFKKDKDGVPRRVDIRYIFGVDIIEVAEQNKKGFVPNPQSDVILIKNGKITVSREGNSIGLFDYLKKCSYNTTNPERNPQTEGCFQEVVPEREKLDLNEFAFAEAEALELIRPLVLQRTDKGATFDEDRLDTFCRLFEIGGANNASRVNALIALAKAYPVEFKARVTDLEQRGIMEIVHGEKLNVIRFTDTQAEYMTKEKIIFSFTGSAHSTEKKREFLAAYFQTAGGAVDYQEFLIELEAAKKSNLN